MNKNVFEDYTGMVKTMAINLIKRGMTREDSQEMMMNTIKEVFDNKDIVLDTLRELIETVNNAYNDGSGKCAIYRASFNPESIMYPGETVYREAIKNANGDPVVVVDFTQNMPMPVKTKKKEFNPIVRTRRYILIDIDRCYTEEDRVDIIARINHIINPAEYPAVESRKPEIKDMTTRHSVQVMDQSLNALPTNNNLQSNDEE